MYIEDVSILNSTRMNIGMLISNLPKVNETQAVVNFTCHGNTNLRTDVCLGIRNSSVMLADLDIETPPPPSFLKPWNIAFTKGSVATVFRQATNLPWPGVMFDDEQTTLIVQVPTLTIELIVQLEPNHIILRNSTVTLLDGSEFIGSVQRSKV